MSESVVGSYALYAVIQANCEIFSIKIHNIVGNVFFRRVIPPPRDAFVQSSIAD